MKNLAYHLAYLGVLWYTTEDNRGQMTLDYETITVLEDLCQRSSAVELWFCKPVVVGSNPTVGFFVNEVYPAVSTGSVAAVS